MAKSSAGDRRVDRSSEHESFTSTPAWPETKEEFTRRLQDKGILDELHRLNVDAAITPDDLWLFFCRWAPALASGDRKVAAAKNWRKDIRDAANELRAAVSALRRARELFPFPFPWYEFRSLDDALNLRALLQMRKKNPPVVVIGDVGAALLRYAKFLEAQASDKTASIKFKTWFHWRWAEFALEKTGGKNVLDSVGAMLFGIVFDCEVPDFATYQKARERAQKARERAQKALEREQVTTPDAPKADDTTIV